MARATLLLPARARFGAQRLSAGTVSALGRGTRRTPVAPGRRAQLRRYFDLPPDAWPIAALARQADAGDAAGAAWLRADPAWLRPDLAGVKLMAHGAALGLDGEGERQLLSTLQPLFADAGFALDAPVAGRWYLRLPRETRLPATTDPDDALGDDLFDPFDGTGDGRLWRTLGSEAQVLLHHHPHNARRAALGLPPVNALWFWGGGMLPEAGVRGLHATVSSDDATVHALGAAAAVAGPLPPHWPATTHDALYDLPAVRDLAALEHDWLRPAIDALRRGGIDRLELDFEDGHAFELGRRDRMRLWRRPRSPFEA